MDDSKGVLGLLAAGAFVAALLFARGAKASSRFDQIPPGVLPPAPPERRESGGDRSSAAGYRALQQQVNELAGASVLDVDGAWGRASSAEFAEVVERVAATVFVPNTMLRRDGTVIQPASSAQAQEFADWLRQNAPRRSSSSSSSRSTGGQSGSQLVWWRFRRDPFGLEGTLMSMCVDAQGRALPYVVRAGLGLAPPDSTCNVVAPADPRLAGRRGRKDGTTFRAS